VLTHADLTKVELDQLERFQSMTPLDAKRLGCDLSQPYSYFEEQRARDREYAEETRKASAIARERLAVVEAEAVPVREAYEAARAEHTRRAELAKNAAAARDAFAQCADLSVSLESVAAPFVSVDALHVHAQISERAVANAYQALARADSRVREARERVDNPHKFVHELATERAAERAAGRPAEPSFMWNEEDACLLAALLERTGTSTPSELYASIFGREPSDQPRMMDLARLAGVTPQDSWGEADRGLASNMMCRDDRFLKRLSHALRGSLHARFGLDPERGAALRRGRTWSPEQEAPPPLQRHYRMSGHEIDDPNVPQENPR
jgi:hypothetical protein